MIKKERQYRIDTKSAVSIDTLRPIKPKTHKHCMHNEKPDVILGKSRLAFYAPCAYYPRP